MLDMGFIDDMRFILGKMRRERHTLFFCATMSKEIEKLIGEYLYTQKTPNGQEIVDMLPEVPMIKERQGIIDRIKAAIENIVDIFEW